MDMSLMSAFAKSPGPDLRGTGPLTISCTCYA